MCTDHEERRNSDTLYTHCDLTYYHHHYDKDSNIWYVLCLLILSVKVVMAVISAHRDNIIYKIVLPAVWYSHLFLVQRWLLQSDSCHLFFFATEKFKKAWLWILGPTKKIRRSRGSVKITSSFSLSILNFHFFWVIDLVSCKGSFGWFMSSLNIYILYILFTRLFLKL